MPRALGTVEWQTMPGVESQCGGELPMAAGPVTLTSGGGELSLVATDHAHQAAVEAAEAIPRTCACTLCVPQVKVAVHHGLSALRPADPERGRT